MLYLRFTTIIWNRRGIFESPISIFGGTNWRFICIIVWWSDKRQSLGISAVGTFGLGSGYCAVQKLDSLELNMDSFINCCIWDDYCDCFTIRTLTTACHVQLHPDWFPTCSTATALGRSTCPKMIWSDLPTAEWRNIYSPIGRWNLFFLLFRLEGT